MAAKKTIWAAMAAALLLTLAACEKEGPMERAGEKADKAVEEAGERVDNAVEKAGEAIENVGDKVKDATN